MLQLTWSFLNCVTKRKIERNHKTHSLTLSAAFHGLWGRLWHFNTTSRDCKITMISHLCRMWEILKIWQCSKKFFFFQMLYIYVYIYMEEHFKLQQYKSSLPKQLRILYRICLCKYMWFLSVVLPITKLFFRRIF